VGWLWPLPAPAADPDPDACPQTAGIAARANANVNAAFFMVDSPVSSWAAELGVCPWCAGEEEHPDCLASKLTTNYAALCECMNGLTRERSRANFVRRLTRGADPIGAIAIA
jgi:hypothetical protein